MRRMSSDDLQSLCELGSQLLAETRYLEAEETLVRAEAIARRAGDWDTLARLYMPLQETRRQRRQCCGEGVVKLDLIAAGPEEVLDPEHIVARYPHGQLLIAGWESLAPALRVRELARERRLYLETFLASVHRVADARVVVIYPSADVSPPAKCTVLRDDDLPSGERKGTTQTYAEVMDLWERLHAPMLRHADQTADPIARIEAYRRTIDIDYACEFAHQRLSETARLVARR
jgi:hypothetical protein